MPPSPTALKQAITHLTAQILAYESALSTLDAQISRLHAEISRADAVTAVLLSGNETMLTVMRGAAVHAQNRPSAGAAGTGKDDRRGGDVGGSGGDGQGTWKGKSERGKREAERRTARAGKRSGAETAALETEVSRIWGEVRRLEDPGREGGAGGGAG